MTRLDRHDALLAIRNSLPEALCAADLRWCFRGSEAVAMYARPRYVRRWHDLDLYVEGGWEAIHGSIESAVTRGLTVLSLKSPMQVSVRRFQHPIFSLPIREFEVEQLGVLVQATKPQSPMPLTTLEDLPVLSIGATVLEKLAKMSTHAGDQFPGREPASMSKHVSDLGELLAAKPRLFASVLHEDWQWFVAEEHAKAGIVLESRGFIADVLSNMDSTLRGSVNRRLIRFVRHLGNGLP